MTTIKDIARLAGVSVATVSRVANKDPKVSDKTRDKITKLMLEMGYQPNATARALVTKKSTAIGVVIPQINDPFFALLANGVDQVAREQNRQLLLSTCQLTQASERDAIRTLLETRCEAIVVHSKLLPEEELIALSEKVPGLVIIDRYIEKIANRCIWLDNIEGGKMAAQHLAALGHKEFAFVNSEYPIDDPVDRLAGFQQQLSQEQLVLSAEKIASAPPNEVGGEKAMLEILEKQQTFSAVFAYNDAMAIGAMAALARHGLRVPQDVSLVGFDDVLIAQYCQPKLTTLKYPIEKMAHAAAKLALQLQQGDKKPPNASIYTPRLIQRQSTAHASDI